MMKIIAGVDLCSIVGLSEVTVLEVISETGTDMSKWPDGKSFAAWLNLVPNTKITGGKIISSKMEKKKNFAGQSIRMAASGLVISKTPIGDYARKMRARIGKKGGVVATAHKLARIIYATMKNKTEYDPQIMVNEREQWQQIKIKRLEKQIELLKNKAM